MPKTQLAEFSLELGGFMYIEELVSSWKAKSGGQKLSSSQGTVAGFSTMARCMYRTTDFFALHCV